MNLACPDWFDRLKAGRPPIADLDLNVKEAANALAIFNKLRVPDIPGQPAFSEAAGDWSRSLVSSVFGSVKTNDNGFITGRTIRKFLVEVPKKNAKTTTAAGVMLTALIRNRRPRAEYLLVGPTQAIADLAFDQIVGMINADKYLASRFKVREAKKEIVDLEPGLDGATLAVKTFDAKIVTGTKPVGVLVDELHELGKIPNAAKIMTQLRGGIIANAEGFLIYITTQSDEPPSGVWKSELEFARDIRDGNVTGDLLPMLFEFPLEMQKAEAEPWRDPATWHIVTPNMGRSIQLETLKTEFNEAEAKGKDELSIWLSQHLNIQIGLGMHKDRWRGADYWLQAVDRTLTFETLVARSEVCVMGVDGGGLDDLFGLAVMGRDRETQEWLLWGQAWAYDDVFDRRASITPQLNDFRDDGSLIVCDFPEQEIVDVVQYAVKLQERGLLPEANAIGLDPFGVSAVVDELESEQIGDDQVVAVPQGVRLASAIWGMERMLKSRKCRPAAQPLMNWCVGNARGQKRGNSVLITKELSGAAKIDPLIAAFNAFQLMSRNPVAAAAAQTPWDADPKYRMAS